MPGWPFRDCCRPPRPGPLVSCRSRRPAPGRRSSAGPGAERGGVSGAAGAGAGGRHAGAGERRAGPGVAADGAWVALPRSGDRAGSAEPRGNRRGASAGATGAGAAGAGATRQRRASHRKRRPAQPRKHRWPSWRRCCAGSAVAIPGQEVIERPLGRSLWLGFPGLSLPEPPRCSSSRAWLAMWPRIFLTVVVHGFNTCRGAGLKLSYQAARPCARSRTGDYSVVLSDSASRWRIAWKASWSIPVASLMTDHSIPARKKFSIVPSWPSWRPFWRPFRSPS